MILCDDDSQNAKALQLCSTPKLKMTTEYIQPRINVPQFGSIKLGTIERLEIKDGEEINVKYRWVRGRGHPFGFFFKQFYTFSLLILNSI